MDSPDSKYNDDSDNDDDDDTDDNHDDDNENDKRRRSWLPSQHPRRLSCHRMVHVLALPQDGDVLALPQDGACVGTATGW